MVQFRMGKTEFLYTVGVSSVEVGLVLICLQSCKL